MKSVILRSNSLAFAERLQVISPPAQDGSSSGWEDRIGLIEKAIQSFQNWTETIEERFSRLEANVVTNNSKISEIHQVLESLERPEDAKSSPRGDQIAKENSSSSDEDEYLNSLQGGSGEQSEVEIVATVESDIEAEPRTENTSTPTTSQNSEVVSKGSKSAASKRKRKSPPPCMTEVTTTTKTTDSGKKPKSKTNSDKPGYKCETCGKIFLSFENYKDDQRYHSLGRLKCHLCTYEVITMRKFKQHFQTAHPGRSPTKLPAFEVEFPTAPGQLFACPFESCAKTYASNGSLSMHLKYHRGETFKCTLCDYETPRKRDLERHTKSMHSNPSHDTIRSGNASSKTVKSASKSSPRRIKRGYSSVGKTTDTQMQIPSEASERAGSNSLERDESVDDPDEDFECPLCSRCFSERRKLDRHLQDKH